MEDTILTTQDVAKMLRVTVQTVRKWAVSGQLKGVKAGRDYRFKQKAIDDFLRDGCENLSSERKNELIKAPVSA